MTQHIMIDLETLDTNPTSVVLSVGMCHFDIEDGTIHDTYHRVLRVQDQIDAGRTVSASTLAWWITQSSDAKAAVFDVPPEKQWEMRPLCWDMRDFINEAKGKEGCRMWAKGPHFDITIIEHLFDMADVPYAWSYQSAQCVRTICNLAPKYEGDDIGTAHNALDDAIYQAKAVAHAYAHINR